MGIEVYAAILGTIGLISGIIAVWINLNVKVKELEVRIVGVENQVRDIKVERLEIREDIKLYNEKIWDKLENIDNKLDERNNLLTVLKTEHEQMKNLCKYNKNNKI